MHHPARRRPARVLLVLLTVLASVVGVGALAAPASADPATTVITMTVLGGDHPAIGDTVTLRAEVTAGGSPVPVGYVGFDAAETVAKLWGADSFADPFPDATDVPLDPVPVGADGVATLDVTLTKALLPFLRSGGTFYVAGEYQPYELHGLGNYQTTYRSSDSAPVALTMQAAPTTTTVTGPAAAFAGVPTTLTATVSPSGAAGSVQFSVDGTPVGASVTVTAGRASLAHTFPVTGSPIVTAVFTPDSPASYTASADGTGRRLTVAPVHETATILTGDMTRPRVFADLSQVRVRVSARVTSPDLSAPVGNVQFGTPEGPVGAPVPVVNGVATANFGYADFFHIVHVRGWLGPSYVDWTFPAWDAVADFVPANPGFRSSEASLGATSLTTTIVGDDAAGAPVATGSTTAAGTTTAAGSTSVNVETGTVGQPGASATVTTSRGAGRRAGTKVSCLPTPSGYSCPLGVLPAGTKFTATITYPLPSGAAGKRLSVRTSAAVTDPVTGTTTLLAASTASVAVPKRTVLSASLTPVKKLTAVKHGAATPYRVVVKNVGVVTATGVKACATLSAGATVRAAKGATVHGRTVCWTLPTLRKGKSVTRTLTLVAPRKKGTVKVALAVTPKKSQASPVRLTATLPVR